MRKVRIEEIVAKFFSTNYWIESETLDYADIVVINNISYIVVDVKKELES